MKNNETIEEKKELLLMRAEALKDFTRMYSEAAEMNGNRELEAFAKVMSVLAENLYRMTVDVFREEM